MYLKKIRLQNIKCFEDVTLEFRQNEAGTTAAGTSFWARMRWENRRY